VIVKVLLGGSVKPATTANAAFQIGSITKLFTATLMMQLVDEERVELDAPVKRYLPDFSVADPAAPRP
jgi:CubicO group peptidase (beta-lactamase class C family)